MKKCVLACDRLVVTLDIASPAKKIVKDLFDLTREDLAGFDVVIDAFGAWTPETLPLHKTSLRHLCDVLSGTDVRLLVVGGAGLSTAAGFTYSGERFERYFSDFEAKYGFHDMYSGGFYPYASLEEFWAYWSRYIYVNRYDQPAGKPYEDLLSLVKEKDCFVLTTNVDHRFQTAGFDKERLFYTQGDYGLLQCSQPCHNRTYDNESAVREMLKAQKDMRIPTELIPRCPVCGKPMTTNLRADDTFVEDAGWHAACARYQDFLTSHKKGKMLYLELGVGMNTPGIIKYPFWQMTYRNKDARYVCINLELAYAPKEIADRSVCLAADIGSALEQLLEK